LKLLFIAFESLLIDTVRQSNTTLTMFAVDDMLFIDTPRRLARQLRRLRDDRSLLCTQLRLHADVQYSQTAARDVLLPSSWSLLDDDDVDDDDDDDDDDGDDDDDDGDDDDSNKSFGVWQWRDDDSKLEWRLPYAFFFVFFVLLIVFCV
jgi:hypothetical protein